MRAVDEQALLDDICRIVCQEAGYRMAWVGFAEHDEAKTVRPVASAGFEEGYLERAVVSWAETELGRGPIGTAIRTGRTVLPAGLRHRPARRAVARGSAAARLSLRDRSAAQKR
jgi:hypothetical protein